MADETHGEIRSERPGLVVWLTGLSGAGKTTLAMELSRRLEGAGTRALVLDGDELRRGICADLGFSAADRKENMRRVGEVGRLLARSGQVAIVALISPYREDRALVRARCEPGVFLEVHVACPLEECERRDPKGMYRKARMGQIPNFTGVSAPYEPPDAPELVVPTHVMSLGESASLLHAAVDRALESLRKA
jgi:adenylyl-sulfate kinase